MLNDQLGISKIYISKPNTFMRLIISICMHFLFGGAMASDFVIGGVNFIEKKPSAKSSIEDSLINYNESEEILKNDVSAIGVLKGKFNIKIVGYTDNDECVGSECDDLSFRRAKLIYEWMLAHGVSSTQLLPPEGCGSADPAISNATSKGRAINRRIEFQWVPILPKS